MKIKIASQNPVKVEALQEILQDYSYLKNAEVVGVDVTSGVSDQPRSLDESVQGAMNRAKNAFKDCNYSFGIESGLMKVSNSKTGSMAICICAIFDGNEYHLGLSSAWEVPKKVFELMEKGETMNNAVYKAGLTDNPKNSHEGGLVGILTRGRLTRKEYTKEAIRTALIHVDKD